MNVGFVDVTPVMYRGLGFLVILFDFLVGSDSVTVDFVASVSGGDTELGLEPGNDATPGVESVDDLAIAAGLAGGDTELGLEPGSFGGRPLAGISASGVSSLS